jgi:hypothetical protein
VQQPLVQEVGALALLIQQASPQVAEVMLELAELYCMVLAARVEAVVYFLEVLRERVEVLEVMRALAVLVVLQILMVLMVLVEAVAVA